MEDLALDSKGQLSLLLWLERKSGDCMVDGEQAASVVPGDMIRELDELHKLFDALGVGPGYAADRLHNYFQHKLVAFRANGHQDSCQCQTCCEARLIARTFQSLRDVKAVAKSQP